MIIEAQTAGKLSSQVHHRAGSDETITTKLFKKYR
jgi:hypothetical protein